VSTRVLHSRNIGRAVGVDPPVTSDRRSFDIQLVGPGEISGAGKYESPDGQPPEIDDVIPVDEHGGRARVTKVTSDEPPLIRAELV
jgi:hypothetical protein